MLKSVFDCSKKEIKEILKTLNDDEKNHFLNERRRFGHNALKDAKLKKFQLLVESGIDVNNTDYDGGALFYSDIEKTKILIEHGVNLNKTRVTGNTILFHAKNTEHATLLIEAGIDINHVNARGESALFYVDDDVALLLLEKGIDTSIVSESSRENALFYSTSKTLYSMIEHGADIHQVSDDHETILFYYAHLGDYDSLAYLIKQDINMKQINNKGVTFLNKVKDINKLLSLLDMPELSDQEYTNTIKLIDYISSYIEKQKILKNIDKDGKDNIIRKRI